MNEIILNLHMHTALSDGEGSYESILQAAAETGVDAVIVTDHNVWVDGSERIFNSEGKRVLLLIGEEIHDQARNPQKNHLLVLNAKRELAPYARNPQELIDRVASAGGMCFLAHPMETELPAFREPDISWVDWQVTGFTGVELWNGFSEFKAVVHNRFEAFFYAFFPSWIAHGPPVLLLKKWDELLRADRQIVGIGGSDAHALKIHLGPLHHVVFPYKYHFRCINTHLLLEASLVGNLDHDRSLIYAALGKGHAFVGYDLPHSTKGFRFEARSGQRNCILGDQIPLDHQVEFHIEIPGDASCVLLLDGKVIKRWNHQPSISYVDSRPGVYRVECRKKYLGFMRGWIFSNPIYVLEK
jgi:hypothetical protein